MNTVKGRSEKGKFFRAPRLPLTGSFKGDIDMGIDIDVDMDVDMDI